VKIGGRTDHGAWITDGLKLGENIVTQGAYGMDDSATVKTEDGSRKPEAGSPKAEAGSAKPSEKDRQPATASKKP